MDVLVYTPLFQKRLKKVRFYMKKDNIQFCPEEEDVLKAKKSAEVILCWIKKLPFIKIKSEFVFLSNTI